MKKFISYPSIEQYRNVIKQVELNAQYVGKDSDGNAIYDKTVKLPTIEFKGTIKLHGTNASVCYNGVTGLWAQSRNNIITVENDNAGFAFFVETHKHYIQGLIDILEKNTGLDLYNNTVSIYGEWCGGNIQKGVAITGLEKMFVVFGIKITPHSDIHPAYWIESKDFKCPEKNIFNIEDFPTLYINIDFNNPQMQQNELVRLTELVEAECPVGKHFGVSGVGEGIVWKGSWNGNNYTFKVKGEKHSASKVKKLAEVDIEKINNIDAFVEYACTENRLNQGIEQVFTINSLEPDRKLTGNFVKWVTSDIIKEELDTIAANGLEPKDVMGRVSKKASQWFSEYLNRQVGLK